MAIVTAYQIRSTDKKGSRLGERYYAERADAEADAAILTGRAPKVFRDSVWGIPAYEVEAVRTSHHCISHGARFVSNRRAA